MFISDLAALQKLTSKPTANVGDNRQGDVGGDPEIDRMYHYSPLITDWSATFQMEDMYEIDERDTMDHTIDDSLAKKRAKDLFPKDDGPLFRPVEVDKEKIAVTIATSSARPSALTKLIEESKTASKNGKNTAGKMKCTIYLPDYNNFDVYAWESTTVGELLRLILEEHRDQALQPPLHYRDITSYEIRMHEGDGEPDRDFPALSLTKQLGHYNLDEYCLCEIEGRTLRANSSPSGHSGHGGGGGQPSGGGGYGSTRRSQQVSVTESMFPASQFGSIMNGGNTSLALANRMNNHSTAAAAGNGGGMRVTPPLPVFPAMAGYDNNSNCNGSNGNGPPSMLPPGPPAYLATGSTDELNTSYHDGRDTPAGIQIYYPSSVTIRFPNGQELEIPLATADDEQLQQQQSLKDMIPYIAQLYKIRLHTDEYIFIVSADDQRRLKMMSPIVDMTVPIYTIGAQVFDMQKKVYADSAKVPKVTVPVMVSKSQREKASNEIDNQSTFIFNEATANAYKEWNVIKKNKFGRKQERIFGVDGKKVYNGKRGGLLKGNLHSAGVQRAERDINTIVKIEILSNDSKTFRITWLDDSMYNIEYTCDAGRECAEIVAKIRFILNKGIRGGGGGGGTTGTTTSGIGTATINSSVHTSRR